MRRAVQAAALIVVLPHTDAAQVRVADPEQAAAALRDMLGKLCTGYASLTVRACGLALARHAPPRVVATCGRRGGWG